MTWAARAGALLLSVAAIVTPLGLYDAVVPGSKTQPVAFHYSKDTGAFGLGTPPRPTLGFSRICDGVLPVACPNSNNNVTRGNNGTDYWANVYGGYNTKILRRVYDYFQSGHDDFNQSVSSIFDIQWRIYTTRQDKEQEIFANGSTIIVGDFRQLTSVVLNDAIELVEGLVVDSRRGSIGFRNHTVPAKTSYGATWSEDLLFIQPETECVDTNLTFDFTIPPDGQTSGVLNLRLVDHGGFANLDHERPYYEYWTAQTDPNLRYRAYTGAWANNYLTMLLYNLTNPGPAISGMERFSYMKSFVGRSIPFPAYNYSNESTYFRYTGLGIGQYGNYLGEMPYRYSNGTLQNITDPFKLNMPPNPWGLAADNFTDIRKCYSSSLFRSTTVSYFPYFRVPMRRCHRYRLCQHKRRCRHLWAHLRNPHTDQCGIIHPFRCRIKLDNAAL